MKFCKIERHNIELLIVQKIKKMKIERHDIELLIVIAFFELKSNIMSNGEDLLKFY